jgi:FMN phosphatase YigB (HAD superfamily)
MEIRQRTPAAGCGFEGPGHRRVGVRSQGSSTSLDRLWPDENLLSAIEAHPQVSLVSFDVFDTVVTRCTGDPTAVFLSVGQNLVRRGVIRCTPESFARYRIDCERRARRNKRSQGRSEVSIREIYEEVSFGLGLLDNVERLIETELEAEAESICGIPQMRTTVDLVRQRFGRVVFISDMYLPHEFLKARLRELKLLAPGDRLYVSSEFGVQKGNGGLFRVVLEAEELRPEQLLHCGDSVQYDVLPASALGIFAFHVSAAVPNPSEQTLNAHSLHSGGFGATVAGTSRLARLEGMHLEPLKRAFWETGASVTGPLVFLLALWIIERAHQRGVRQLLFLARDGYFPHLAVQYILDHVSEPGLEVRYLHGSRATYRVLNVEQLCLAEWTRLTISDAELPITIQGIQMALMADADTLAGHVGRLGFVVDDWVRPLDRDEIERIRDHALTDRTFNNALMEGIRVAQDRARALLYEQGFDPSSGTALVDSGWTTRSHAPLYRFLRKEGCNNLRLFYVGVDTERTAIPASAIDTFIFDRARATGIRSRGVCYPRAVESLLLSDHGRTQSFSTEQGRIVPVLAEPENGELLGEVFPAYKGGILTFLQKATPFIPRALGAHHDLRELAEGLVARFWLNPTANEARAWGKLTWEHDVLGTAHYPLASPYRLRDVWAAFAQAGYPKHHPQFWSGGALAVTPPWIRRALEGAISIRKACSRVVRGIPGRGS